MRGLGINLRQEAQSCEARHLELLAMETLDHNYQCLQNHLACK